VADDQLSLAIGRKGQNVRLVAKLTGWKIDVRSEGMEEVVSSEDKYALSRIEEIDEPLAEALQEERFRTIEDLAKTSVEKLIEVEGIDEALAQVLIEKAIRIVHEA
jgi:N utilization substance protein A